MEHTSPLAWVCVGAIVLVIVVVNVWMVALLRNGDPRTINRTLRMPKGKRAEQINMQRFVEVLRDPFREDKQQLDNLAKEVDKLKQQPPDSK